MPHLAGHTFQTSRLLTLLAVTGLSILVAAPLLACGGDEPKRAQRPAQGRPGDGATAGVIERFQARLVSPTTVEVIYRISRAARLSLEVEGAEMYAPAGSIPFGRGRNFAAAATETEVVAAGNGSATINFECGQPDFSESPRLRFRLRARLSAGKRFRTQPITLNRDGLFGRGKTTAALRANERRCGGSVR